MRRLFKLATFVLGLVGGWLLVNRVWNKWQPQQVVAPVPLVEPEHVEPVPIPSEKASQPASDGTGDTPSAQPASVASAEPLATQPEPVGNADSPPVAYCVRCRQKQPVQNPVYETTPKGRRRLRGTCAVCGAKVPPRSVHYFDNPRVALIADDHVIPARRVGFGGDGGNIVAIDIEHMHTHPRQWIAVDIIHIAVNVKAGTSALEIRRLQADAEWKSGRRGRWRRCRGARRWGVEQDRHQRRNRCRRWRGWSQRGNRSHNRGLGGRCQQAAFECG